MIELNFAFHSSWEHASFYEQHKYLRIRAQIQTHIQHVFSHTSLQICIMHNAQSHACMHIDRVLRECPFILLNVATLLSGPLCVPQEWMRWMQAGGEHAGEISRVDYFMAGTRVMSASSMYAFVHVCVFAHVCVCMFCASLSLSLSLCVCVYVLYMCVCVCFVHICVYVWFVHVRMFCACVDISKFLCLFLCLCGLCLFIVCGVANP